MKDEMKKIADVQDRLTSIWFQDHLSREDYAKIDELEAELKKLRDEFDTTDQWYVELVFKDNKKPFYLSNDPVTCISDAPYYFESKEEAEEYYNKSTLNKDKDFVVNFIQVK